MIVELGTEEVIALVRPEIDAHTLGVSMVGKLLEDCGYKIVIGDMKVAEVVATIAKLDNISYLTQWLIDNKVTRLGFSYRLDPQDAQNNFGKVFSLLQNAKMFKAQGGPILQLYFAGLPDACNRINNEYNGAVPVFVGDESQVETLVKLGVPKNKIPTTISRSSKYDDDRKKFAEELIQRGTYKNIMPVNKALYEGFGTFKDKVVNRIKLNRIKKYPPLMRVHVGPYSSNYMEAKAEFKSWLRKLAIAGHLDIVSVGSSQLSQSHFEQEWGNLPNGGGVPINSKQDLVEIWEAARPMLVRTYAGTKNIPYLAQVYESTINIAWHALSFWWFNQIDSRGPYTVKENLKQHIETLKVIAKTDKPFEPNIPHHFSFRGADDVSYVLSAYLAAKTAKKYGIKNFILQVMLNTPKYTWGVQDLAKARASLKLVRELEDSKFHVFLQPRAGLDYFSPDLGKAKIQLATVSAMMDDIEPDNPHSPDIIHVVSYCEAVKLATPEYINESIQITINALQEYRLSKKLGLIDSMTNNIDVEERTLDLYTQVKGIVALIEMNIDNPYSPDGLYQIFKLGIMPVPYLWEGRVEFKEAVKWKTSLVAGGVKVVDEQGQVVNSVRRVSDIFDKKNLS